MFVCLRGMQFDSHNYIQDAINNGAVCILTDQKYPKPQMLISLFCGMASIEKVFHTIGALASSPQAIHFDFLVNMVSPILIML